MTAPTRPVLRWHGGKWLLAPWIIGFFPKHRVYVEPFGGAASVLLRKERVTTEIYNDLDADLVNLFRILRDRPDDLRRAIALTPFARDEYKTLYEGAEEPVERARRFVSRSFMGQSSKGAMSRSGFDTRVNEDAFVSRLRSLVSVPDEVLAVAGRMSHVIIENDDAMRLMARHDRPDALIYADPPYLPATRAAAVYRHEFDTTAHIALLAFLCRLKGMVVLSGYPHSLYDDALVGWSRFEREALADGARPRTEVVWINPACAAALLAEGRRPEQLSLLDGAA